MNTKLCGLKIKLCGLRRQEDVQYVNEFIPDYVGFVFADSKRKISPDMALSLIRNLNRNIRTVGVFVNEDVDSIVLITQHVGLDVIQLHGDEDAQYISNIRHTLPKAEIWKAVRVRDEKSIILADSLPVHKLLLDAFSMEAYGGTGRTADLKLIKALRSKMSKPFFMAGGLDINNIENTADAVLPYGVDISSGIETDDCKDKEKIKAVVQLVKGMRGEGI